MKEEEERKKKHSRLNYSLDRSIDFFQGGKRSAFSFSFSSLSLRASSSLSGRHEDARKRLSKRLLVCQMSKAASRGSKVELVATTMDDSSPGPLTRSARKNAAAGGAPKPSSSSRFGAEAAAASGSSRASKATTAAAAKKDSTTTLMRGATRGAQQKASPSPPPKYSVLLPTYCEAQNIGIIVSMLVKVFEEK